MDIRHDPKHPPIVAVNTSPAMSGFFATLYWWNPEMSGFYEPYDTGIGRYRTWQEANVEGEAWAKELGVEFQPATQERVDQSARDAANGVKRHARIKELAAQGIKGRDALDKVRAEYPYSWELN